jgi:hypothetical protein
MQYNYSFLYRVRPGEWECKEVHVNQLLRSTQWPKCYSVTIFDKAGLPKLMYIFLFWLLFNRKCFVEFCKGCTKSYTHYLVVTYTHYLVVTYTHYLVVTYKHYLVVTYTHYLVVTYTHYLVVIYTHYLVVTYTHYLVVTYTHYLVVTYTHYLVVTYTNYLVITSTRLLEGECDKEVGWIVVLFLQFIEEKFSSTDLHMIL